MTMHQSATTAEEQKSAMWRSWSIFAFVEQKHLFYQLECNALV